MVYYTGLLCSRLSTNKEILTFIKKVFFFDNIITLLKSRNIQVSLAQVGVNYTNLIYG